MVVVVGVERVLAQLLDREMGRGRLEEARHAVAAPLRRDDDEARLGRAQHVTIGHDFLVGKPGSSKTLTMQVIQSNAPSLMTHREQTSSFFWILQPLQMKEKRW